MPRLSIGEIKDLLPVDRFKLDTALELQMTLFSDASDHYLEAIEIRDTAKADQQKIELVVSSHFRTNWDTLVPGVRMSEDKLKHAVALDAKVEAAGVMVRETTLFALKRQYLVDMIKRRGEVLSSLVSLYGAQYFTIK